MDNAELSTWEGVLNAYDLGDLVDHVIEATFIGQRAGDFSLGRSLEGGAMAWSMGRCFNEDLEIRWWPTDDGCSIRVLILNRLPMGWTSPEDWTSHQYPLADGPVDVRYLCVGQYDTADPDGSHLWWETRYGRTFAYLDSAPPNTDERNGRVYLCAVTYELQDGCTQHRLVRFEHARAEDEK